MSRYLQDNIWLFPFRTIFAWCSVRGSNISQLHYLLRVQCGFCGMSFRGVLGWLVTSCQYIVYISSWLHVEPHYANSLKLTTVRVCPPQMLVHATNQDCHPPSDPAVMHLSVAYHYTLIYTPRVNFRSLPKFHQCPWELCQYSTVFI